MMKKNLRIHKSKHNRHLTQPISLPLFSMTQESSKIDNAKQYLASLDEDDRNEEQQKIRQNFTYDLSLTQWKSKNKNNQFVSSETTVNFKDTLLYQQKCQIITQSHKNSQPLQNANSVSIPIHKTFQKAKNKQYFFNFNSPKNNRQANNKNVANRQRKWVRPINFSLDPSEKTQNSIGKKNIRISLNSSSQRQQNIHLNDTINRTGSQMVKFSMPKPLHGIHCFRSKFQLILNSRSSHQKAFRLFRCSSIKPELLISISNRKIK